MVGDVSLDDKMPFKTGHQLFHGTPPANTGTAKYTKAKIHHGVTEFTEKDHMNLFVYTCVPRVFMVKGLFQDHQT
jgi:hypothetical protein